MTTCRCKEACYLTEYGRQSWINASGTVWHHDVIDTMDIGFRTRARRKSVRNGWLPWSPIDVGPELLVAMVILLLVILFFAFASPDFLQEERSQAVDYSEYYEADEKLARIVRSLNGMQRHRATTNNITSLFPWLPLNNTLPNYFIGGGQFRERYASSPVVFVDDRSPFGSGLFRCVNRSAGRDVALLRHDVTAPPGSRSYVSVFQEPMERAVSSYRYCLTRSGQSADELCRVVDAGRVTLRDWILVHGSPVFGQLLSHAPWCGRFEPAPSGAYSPEGSTVAVAAPPGEWPCWLRTRYVVGRLRSRDRAQLVGYVADQLDTWLGAVGLRDDPASTAAILEHVYRMPVGDCFRSPEPASAGYHDNRAANRSRDRGFYDEDDPAYLRYDYFVRRALQADTEIYRAAKQIFAVQRQSLLNKIHK